MAPLAADPRQLVVVLNPARRKAFYTLLFDITGYMRSQLELKDGGDQAADSSGNPASPSLQERNAPLFVRDRGDGRSSSPSHPDRGGSGVHSAQLRALRRAALKHFDGWRKEVLEKVKGIVSVKDDDKILEARKKRLDEQEKLNAESPGVGEDLINFGDASQTASSSSPAANKVDEEVAALQEHYHPIPSRFTTIPANDRKEVLSCLLVLILSTGCYSAHSRVLALYLTSAFGLPLSALIAEETEIAKSLVESATSSEGQKATMSAEAEAAKRRQENQKSRFWKVGLASVAGAAVIGITGGLAAPVVAGAIGGIMGSVGLGGMTGEMMDTYAKEVEDFRFLPLKDEWGQDYKRADPDGKQGARLRVTIGINGWLNDEGDVTKPWRSLGDESEVFALRYEMKSLLALGAELEGLVSSYAWNYVKIEILKRTVLASLWAALWPAYLISAASKIDNPFNLARNRSDKAGRVLADALIAKVQGERPVTLVGYSLGARVIYSCLRSLAERQAFGLVDTVVLIGAPVPSNREHWQVLRSVVSGRIVNVYSETDYILGFLYRTTSLQLGIAGLQEVKDIERVENLNLSAEVSGHLRYPSLIAKILTRCGFPNVKGGEGVIEKDEDLDIKITDEEAGSQMGELIQLEAQPDPESEPQPIRSKQTARFPNELRHPLHPDPPEQKKKKNPNRNKVSRSGGATVSGSFDPLGGGGGDPLNLRSLGQAKQGPRSPHHEELRSLGSPPPEKQEARSAQPADPLNLRALGAKNENPVPTAVENDPSQPGKEPELPPRPSAIHSFQSDGAIDLHRRPGLPIRPKTFPVPVQEEEDDDSDDESFKGIQLVDNEDMTSYSEPLRADD
ncbi:YSIRK family gram-positive signal peptide [Colletotrichum abscissum]|uniref:YSIRK family gram-positive signal peptide n=1 Tax=Colletotrichum abscissum TaxID=1671311 RepID=A0A9Q0B479_9PEZI|nr:YSIRK family gram-positive signal peptide [Colletotrichum abscissum]KAI3547970.1 YSIRK family gram-positive signal peptide [Colletotrichum abscissum]KAK1483773.1 YSIRK family gram-positive signal peptide [Colletotrichum abscissum]